MQDPVADMLTRIKNAQAVAKKEVNIPLSGLKLAIAKVLKDEGFIIDFNEIRETKKPEIVIKLKYHEDKAVISDFTRISRPGLQVYKNKKSLPQVKNGLGVAIISTSKGVMSDREARRRGEGGEVLCYVS